MRYHSLARTTVHSRKLSRQSAGKWVKRYREQGVAGLTDRSSRPQRLWHQTPGKMVEHVERMRREGWTGLRIASTTGLSTATVSRILTRLKLNQASTIEPKPPPMRYEHAAPGDLLHLDIKKLARIVKAGHRITGNPRDETRGAGWEFLYVAVDDHSRIAFTAMYPNQQASSSTDFLLKAATYFARFGITIRRVITDNGPCFLAHRFRDACHRLGISPKRTRHYRPQTNGNAERFIQTAIREWAYARRYENSDQRLDELLPWTHQYHGHRPHTSLQQKTPITRSGLDVNNLLIHHS